MTDRTEALERIVADMWRDLCEKDDRTSPAEYPDMALVTHDELAAIIKLALDALPAEGDGWRPIETAPKDGTVVDIWTKYRDVGARETDCRWLISDQRWIDRRGHTFLVPITHWRYPAAPPAAEPIDG